jgi:hypothetical protein
MPGPDSPLEAARVILDACPPALSDRDKAYAVLQKSFACYNNFHAVSVPDLQDDSEFGRSRERVPNEEFAAWIQSLTEKPLSLYKVSVSCDRGEFEGWLGQAEALGCRDVFLVGGDSGRRPLREGALEVCTAAGIAQARGFHCGGIIIPTRRELFAARPASTDERVRLVGKVRECGLRFFATQILYESEWMCCLLLDLLRDLPGELIPRLFLTFSPFVCEEDILFARKTLGVYVPRDVERMLLGARSMREASISCQMGVWERISSFAGEIGFPADRLGVNVEYLDSRNPRNVEAAFELAEEFGRLFARRGGTGAGR